MMRLSQQKQPQKTLKKKTQWCEMRKRLSDVELSKSENMTQYDPLLPQTSDAFFSSTISILPYFLLPPATYPLQQLLVPVHHPYSFTNHLPHRRDLLQQQHPWLLLPLPQLWQVPQLLVILPVPLILLLVTLVYDSSSSSTTTPEGLPPLLSIVPLHTSPAVYPTPSTSTYFTSMSSTSTYLIPHLQFYYDYLDYHQRRAACQTSKPYSDCE